MGMCSALINASSVIIFAVCLLTGFAFGGYIASMIIAFSFVPMVCALAAKSKIETKAAADIAMIFAGMYATFILIIYFTQVTTLRNEILTEQVVALLDYTTFGLFFNLNLLGYGLMSVSTFFIGLTIQTNSKSAKALKWLLIAHGIFVITSFIMPITGIFTNMEGADIVGTFILLFWCTFFAPIGLLSYKYFKI